MAFMGTLGASSSSSTPSWIYDVFLSFYGKDTRRGFTDHLHVALKRKGIISFIDDKKLEQGKYISQELLKGIQKSRYAVVVISKRYAFSKWCLIELTEIMKCRTKTGLIVLPVFYDVNPSDVRKQEGSFAEAFVIHRENPNVDEEQRKTWRAALKDVGHLSGWHVANRHEAAIVEDISQKILDELRCNSSNIFEGLVGIGCRVEQVISLLCLGLDDVRFIGIWGMGGVGKTTLAKVIYDRVSPQFEASCFVAHVREVSQNYGVVHLQTQLVCEILQESGLKVWNTYTGIDKIVRSINNRNVFIVLDDVDTKEQLKALAGSHSWFGQGSRVIVTTRDRHLLKGYVDEIYEVRELSEDESLELFCRKAFKKDHPEENYVKLSKDIVHYAQGLPLALEVFGSYLFSRKMDAWKAARKQLKEILKADILNKLKISFDGLDDSQKRLFLDIACLFDGKYDPKYDQKLKCLDHYLKIDIEVLSDRCLIKNFQGYFWMHDLLQKMGQQIVYSESPNEPGRRTRLWHLEDIIHVLNNNTGTDAVEGIRLKSSSQAVELSLEGLSKMNNLKIFMCDDFRSYNGFSPLHWYGDFSKFKLSKELRYFQFFEYPLQFLPHNFKPKNLVALKMRYSFINRLDGFKGFDKLKYIDMSFSYNLIEIPDFSGVPNLKELDLQYCTSLSKVHSSLGFLKRLKKLDMEGCKCLTKLPNKMSLKSLEYFNLAGCSILEKFPDIVGNMTSLKCLDLVGTRIQKLPLSFMSFSSLEYLNFCGCLSYRGILYMKHGYNFGGYLIQGNFLASVKKKFLDLVGDEICSFGVLDIEGKGLNPSSPLLPYFFFGISSLKVLDMSFRNLLDVDIPTDLSCLSSIEFLNLSGNKLTTIPISVYQLPRLIKLHLGYCSKLQTLLKPLFSHFSLLRELNLGYCNLSDGMILECLGCLPSLKHLSLAGNKFKRLLDMVQFPTLLNLYLNDCTQLQALPKLPLSLGYLELKNCQSLDISYVESVGGLIDDFTFLAVHIDHVGRPYKILKQSSCPRDGSLLFKGDSWEPCYIVGSALVPRIPKWFNQRISSSFGTMESCFQWLDDVWEGCALLVIYQVYEPSTFQGERKKQKLDEHGNLNYKILNGNKPALPHFLCHFQDNRKASLLLCAPEVPSVGPNAFWVYIPYFWFFENVRGYDKDVLKKGCLDASIESCNLNVRVECWARGVYENDLSELAEVVSDISPHSLDFETCKKLFDEQFSVSGPIKSVKSASTAVIL